MNLVPDILKAIESRLLNSHDEVGSDFIVKRDYAPLVADTEENSPDSSSDYYATSDFQGDPLILLVPAGVESSILSRRSLQDDVSVDVGLVVKLSREFPQAEAVDGLMLKVERIKHVLRPPLDVSPPAMWIGCQAKLLYDTRKLRNNGLFFSVITHKFRVLGSSPL